jgi:hypothetical protein
MFAAAGAMFLSAELKTTFNTESVGIRMILLRTKLSMGNVNVSLLIAINGVLMQQPF